MGEEEKRRCCILGGCGCPPPQQMAAMIEEMKLADSPEDAAKRVMDIFGTGPHKDRLHELGWDKKKDQAADGEGL